MNYSKSTQNEISKYLNAVRKNMQHAPAEEVDEVILHLQEQIDVALEESGDASNEPDHIRRILSTMSQPDSFATSSNKESKGLQWGVVALLAAVVSWGFNLGAVPYFSLVGIAWFLLIAIAAVATIVSRKTVLGKLAMAILILEAVSFPMIHGLKMEPKGAKQSTELSEPGEGQSSPDSKATSPESKRAKETKQLTELSEPAAEKNRTDLTKLQGKWTRQLNNQHWVKEIVGDKETFTIFVDGEAVYGHTHTIKLSKRGSVCIYATSAGQITIGERKGEAMKPFSFIYKLNDDSLTESLGFLDKANNLSDRTEIVTWKRSTALSLADREPEPEPKGSIVLWRVGSPYDGDTPPELVPKRLEDLIWEQGYAVTVRSFAAKDFHKVLWRAAEKNEEPDILYSSDWGIMGRQHDSYTMKTNHGNFTGIAARKNIRESLIHAQGLRGSGTYFLFKTSRNHAKARALATGVTEPELPPSARESMPELAPNEKAAVSKLCIDALTDSITGDGSSIKAMADDFDSLPLRLWSNRVSGAKVGEVKAHGVSGTDRLALGLVTATVDVPRKGARMAKLGQATTLFIFRREHEGEWKLIATRGVGGHEPWIWDILKNLHNAKPQEQESVTIETPKLLSPPDGARRPRWPRTQRTDIEWVGGGDDAVKYVVEAQWGSRGTDQWYLSNFDVFSKKAIEQGENGVIKMRAPFGAGAQPHRWRVWAIGPHGETALSQWRRIDFSN